MSTRTAPDVLHDLLALHEKGATRLFVSIEDYELIIMQAPMSEAMRPTSVEEALGMNLVPTVHGRPVEWRMFYHGEPTDTEPTRRRPTDLSGQA